MKPFNLLFVSLIFISSHSSAKAFSFFGLGKYPSKMDAEEACSKWITKGTKEEYQTRVAISKSEADKILAKHRKEYGDKIRQIDAEERLDSNPRKPITPGSVITYNPYDVQRNASKSLLQSKVSQVENMMVYATKERWSRTCKLEKETNQYIGIDKSNKKYFKY